MKKYVVILISMVHIHLLFAQSFPDFKNETSYYKSGRQTRGIFAAGFLDVNGDLIDDVVSVDNGFEYATALGNASDKPLIPGYSFKFNHFFDAFGLAVADINGDLVADYVTGGSFGYLHLLLSKQNGGFEQSVLPADFLVQTINIVDINQDRSPDIYVSNDNGPNTVFINNGVGQFTENKSLIDFSTNPSSDMSGNYGSVWVDVNLDNLPDLAIAKCKAGVSSPSDPRRINRLFIQQADGNFKDEAVEYNFDLGEQSWAVAFGDLDNDGDMDAFVINHYDPHVLLENINGVRFEARQIGAVPVTSFAFQAVMRDFDNDGWLDIALSGLEGLSFLHNQKNMRFDYINKFNTPLSGMSVTVGDINDDGRIDLHTTLHEPLNFPGKADDRLYINQENNNHYLKCNLLPAPASGSAIGSKIELFGPWGKQTRQVSAGESFGVTNSAQLHFGTGQHSKADSLRITWPSGHVDIFRNLLSDQTWLIQEHTCASPVLSYFPPAIILDTLTGVPLAAPEGYANYRWSEGSTTREITVYKEAQYHVVMEDSSGCLHYTKPVYLERGCFRDESRLLSESGIRVACGGDSLRLQAILAKQYLWNTGDTVRSFVADQSGWYKVTATDFCGKVKVDSVFIRFESIMQPDVVFPDTVPANSMVTLVSSNENTLWMNSETREVLGKGSSITLNIMENDTSFLAAAYLESEAKIQFTGIQNFPAENHYGSNSINGGLVFNALKDVVLRRVSVFTDTPGKRKLLILDDKGQIAYEKEFFIRFGHNMLNVEARLKSGNNYTLTTDKSVNMNELGFAGPRFLRHFNNQQIRYPYVVEEALTITESTSGLNYYYYFYNWEVSYDFQTCLSPSVKIPLAVDTSVSSETPAQSFWQVKIYPNPVGDEIHVKSSDINRDIFMEIVSSLGQVVYSSEVAPGNVVIRTSEWQPGLYLVRLKSKLENQTLKFIKI